MFTGLGSLRDMFHCAAFLQAHDWGRWKDLEGCIVKNVTHLPTQKTVEVGRVMVQVRECSHCGLKQSRRYSL